MHFFSCIHTNVNNISIPHLHLYWYYNIPFLYLITHSHFYQYYYPLFTFIWIFDPLFSFLLILTLYPSGGLGAVSRMGQSHGHGLAAVDLAPMKGEGRRLGNLEVRMHAFWEWEWCMLLCFTYLSFFLLILQPSYSFSLLSYFPTLILSCLVLPYLTLFHPFLSPLPLPSCTPGTWAPFRVWTTHDRRVKAS